MEKSPEPNDLKLLSQILSRAEQLSAPGLTYLYQRIVAMQDAKDQ